MSKLKWNNKLVPLPRTKTHSFEEVTQQAFGYVVFNRTITATLQKDNLVLEDGDAFCFAVGPETQLSLWTSDPSPYIIETRLQPFLDISSEQETITLGPGETAAYLVSGNTVSIEQLDWGRTRLRESTNQIINEDTDANIVELNTSDWVVIENLNHSPIRFKVGLSNVDA